MDSLQVGMVFAAAAMGGGVAGWGFSRLFTWLLVREIHALRDEIQDVASRLYFEKKRRANQARQESDTGLQEAIEQAVAAGLPMGSPQSGRRFAKFARRSPEGEVPEGGA